MENHHKKQITLFVLTTACLYTNTESASFVRATAGRLALASRTLTCTTHVPAVRQLHTTAATCSPLVPLEMKPAKLHADKQTVKEVCDLMRAAFTSVRKSVFGHISAVTTAIEQETKTLVSQTTDPVVAETLLKKKEAFMQSMAKLSEELDKELPHPDSVSEEDINSKNFLELVDQFKEYKDAADATQKIIVEQALSTSKRHNLIKEIV